MPPRVELLYFADCPNYRRALDELRDLLRRERIAARVRLVAVETPEEAARQQFYGSPTIRIDGVDVVQPTATQQPALACRVYRDAQGRRSPMPPIEAIQTALAPYRVPG